MLNSVLSTSYISCHLIFRKYSWKLKYSRVKCNRFSATQIPLHDEAMAPAVGRVLLTDSHQLWPFQYASVALVPPLFRETSQCEGPSISAWSESERHQLQSTLHGHSLILCLLPLLSTIPSGVGPKTLPNKLSVH